MGEGEDSSILSVNLLFITTQVFKTFIKDRFKKSGFSSDLDYGFRNFHSTVILFTALDKKSLTTENLLFILVQQHLWRKPKEKFYDNLY